MTTVSTHRQLVLFDANDNHTDIFDNVEQLSKIPPHCEFYIFFNEKDPIKDKLIDRLLGLLQVRIRPSSGSVSQTMLEFLRANIDQYSFILLVSNQQPCFENIAKNIWKQYGHQKLFFMGMKNQSNINVKNFLNVLAQNKNNASSETWSLHDAQVFAQYPCPQCSKSFNSNDDLQEHSKNFHESNVNMMDLYVDSAANMSFSKKRMSQVKKTFC